MNPATAMLMTNHLLSMQVLKESDNHYCSVIVSTILPLTVWYGNANATALFILYCIRIYLEFLLPWMPTDNLQKSENEQ